MIFTCSYCNWVWSTIQHTADNCPNCGTMPNGLVAKTQKAKGLLALKKHYGYETPVIRTLSIIQSKEGVEKVKSGSYFARPCPLTPRHGFVESRVVTTKGEILKIFEETIAADPEGEVALTEVLPQHENLLNAVVTPHSLCVGKGHDGATGGKNTVTIPLAPIGVAPAYQYNEDLIQEAGIKTYPYVEAVVGQQGSGDGAILTQLRDGPVVSETGGDWIPIETIVTKVVKPDGDLLKWETLMKEAQKGWVVWNPGGGPTDHASIHARLHDVPIVYGKTEPLVGETLVPTAKVEKFDTDALLRGAIIADEIDFTKNPALRRSAVNLLLLALHNASVMTGESTKWLGFATVAMLRLGSLALRGEARHVVKYNVGGSYSTPMVARESVYDRYAKRSVSFHRACVGRLVNLFRYGPWPSGGIGGIKWAKCGNSLIPLFNALRDLARDKDDKTTKALILALNVAVHQAHNGGWWLNKFAHGHAPSEVPAANPAAIAQAAQAILSFADIEAKIDSTEIVRKLNKWAEWKDTKCRVIKVEEAEIATGSDFAGGINYSLTFKTDVSKKPRKMLISTSEIVKALLGPKPSFKPLVDANGSIRIVWEHDGSQTEIVKDVLDITPMEVPANGVN